ncbi:hypothetical protein TcasGA2_TC008211 [Tribolium castaneum]|uniref:Peptidase S1 domain-containing protein n=1 Tax=Tribolium castaneum TaxID=7070 RepID=D2A0H9_TRICA|nr:PREDICTED: uncharacterized protein LOC107397838 [Tribolium castaneum]EFA02508.1 hypothetical protein TcasGA2_TC008211 [Tribolium castaneum]|eukprot:XP_015834998.1 PREDICTED: uncharacterized protein LOC107397838 [Tribolium castaneum]
MVLGTGDFILLVVTIIFVVADIILGLCVTFALPNHAKRPGWFSADGKARTFKEATNICPCLEKVFPEGSKAPIKFHKVKHIKLEKRSAPEDLITQQAQEYPFLVSLSIPAYSDDPSEKLFACNGLIQDANWLATTQTCVRDKSEWFNLTVRSGSFFWSRGGVEHSVIDVRENADDGLVLLKVTPPFSGNLLPLPPIKHFYGGNWTYAVSLGWDDNMYQKHLTSRFKYKSFEVQKWTSKSCDSRVSNICNMKERSEISSKPLLTSCHQILGMKTVKNNDFGLTDMRNSNDESTENRESKCFPIYEDTCGSIDREVCQSY